MRISRAVAVVALCVLLPPGLLDGQQELRSAAELSGFERHTSHDELLEYLAAVQASSSEMRSGSYGRTKLGRDLPYAVFARPMITQPREALASGKPVLLLAANVHGNERTFRESLLLLARDLATPGTEMNRALDQVVIVMVPTINPDGFEASERGTRGNAWGIDMNRDYMKLENRSLVQFAGNVFHAWYPHLVVDGHNGGSYPYNVNYQATSYAGADPALTALADHEIFPRIDRRLEADGYSAFYYARGTETRWNTGGWQPRIGRNYLGLANSVGILFESPGGQSLEDGVRSGVLAYQAVIEYARDHGDRLRAAVERARQETVEAGRLARGQVPVAQRYAPADTTVTYRIAVGEGNDRRTITVMSDSLMKEPVVTRARERPYAYLLPRDAVAAVELLRRHDIAVEVLEEAVELGVSAYPLTGITYERAYNHAAATRVEVADPVRVTRTFPRGTYLVRTGQEMGRVASHLLEPETSDNVIYWNTMDAWLPKAELQEFRSEGEADEDPPLVPIFKLMAPRGLPTRLVE